MTSNILTNRWRWLLLAIGGVIAVLAVAVVVDRSADRKSSPESARLRAVERAAATVSRCDEHLGISDSGDALNWKGISEAHSVWCGNPEGLEALLSWNQFRSSGDRRKALRVSPVKGVPVCTTATEIFVLAFGTSRKNADFCRSVGAEAPIGRAKS